MNHTIVSALVTVTSPHSPQTHLCASSPQLAGTAASGLPTRTLCGLSTGLRVPTLPVWEVGCLSCLLNCSPYLGLPGWAAGPSSLPPSRPR